MNLSDNRLDVYSCVSLVRAVANRGSKGYFRRLYLKTQKPILTHEELLGLYETTVSLKVGFSADNLNVVQETKTELLFNNDINADEIERMRNAFVDMVKENKLVAAGEISYIKTVYF